MRFLRKQDERGATAVEYGLVIAFGAIVLVALVALFDVPIQEMIDSLPL